MIISSIVINISMVVIVIMHHKSTTCPKTPFQHFRPRMSEPALEIPSQTPLEEPSQIRFRAYGLSLGFRVTLLY